MAWTLHERELERDDVQALLASHFEQMRAISPPEACHVLPIDSLRDSSVSLWSLREGDRLLGIGALKALAPDHGEVKSMRTAPDALGLGVGKTILRHIIAEARSRGYRRLSLETGRTEPFAAALHLYRAEGFVPCAPFGAYVDTSFTCFLTLEL